MSNEMSFEQANTFGHLNTVHSWEILTENLRKSLMCVVYAIPVRSYQEERCLFWFH